MPEALTAVLSATGEARLIRLARRVAAAEILPRFRALDAGAHRAKTRADDLVTMADTAAERAFAAGVADILPEAVVIGEEGVSEDPGLLDALGHADLAVLLDPVDGTWNFAAGIAAFGMLVAVIHRGETVWGLLYDPVLDDWIVARRDGGAWHEGAGRAPRRLVLEGATPAHATSFVPLSLFDEDHREEVARRMARAGRTGSLRCSCHEYRTLLFGGADGIVNVLAQPWDHAAGALAVAEAGGVAALPDGRPYAPVPRAGGFVAARSQEAWQRLIDAYGAFLP